MIVQHPNKILRRKSENVPLEEIGNPKIKTLIGEMKKVLIASAEKGGVALAAPQIGYNSRIFIIFEKLFKISKGGSEAKALLPPRDKVLKEEDEKKPPKFLVFVNPEIVKKSRKKKIMEEGCLSVDGVQGKVKRTEKLTVKACDENGKEFKMSAVGIMSQAIEHEIDHLDGVLFVDKKIKG